MHGIILHELKKYVEATRGGDGWKSLLEKSGAPRHLFLPTRIYPDGEFSALIAAASDMTGTPVPALLADLGRSLVPGLFESYRSLIDPAWKTLDLLESTQTSIHVAVSVWNRDAAPPALSCSRPDRDTVIIEYDSPRKLCHLAKGIIQGIADHYGEQIRLDEQSCMHMGNPACVIEIRM